MKILIATVAVIGSLVFLFGDVSTITSIEELSIIKEAEITYEQRLITPEELQLLDSKVHLVNPISLIIGNIPVLVLLASMSTLETHSSIYFQHPLKSIIGKGIVSITRVINLLFSFKETKIVLVHLPVNDEHQFCNLSPYGLQDLADSIPPQHGTSANDKLIKVTTETPTKMFHPINAIFGMGALTFADSILRVPGSDLNMGNYVTVLLPIVLWSTTDLQGILVNGLKK